MKMKVRELIAQLQAFDPEAEILHAESDSDMDDYSVYSLYESMSEDNAQEIRKNYLHYYTDRSVYAPAVGANAIVRMDSRHLAAVKEKNINLAEEITRNRRVWAAENARLDEERAARGGRDRY